MEDYVYGRVGNDFLFIEEGLLSKAFFEGLFLRRPVKCLLSIEDFQRSSF